MTDTSDLPLTVPAAVLMEHFACPICFEHITKSSMCAPCGHHFCSGCIAECVNRKRTCPCCNAAVAPEQLLHDHQFDTLAAVVLAEKTKSEKQYFDALLFQAEAPAAAPAAAPDAARHLTAVEGVFRTHLRESLAHFRAYFQDLNVRTERRKAAAPPEQHARLDAALQQSIELLVEACNRFLATAMPKPHLLPVPVTLTVPGRDFRAHNVVVKPGDTPEVLRAALRARMLEEGLKIVEMDHDDDDALFELVDSPVPVPLQPRVDILLQIAIPPQAELAYHGRLVLQQDLPRSCYADQPFNKENPQVVNYYRCEDCDSNWICEACRECCHAGHRVTGYLREHRPTWACCYCPKKKKCCIKKQQKT